MFLFGEPNMYPHYTSEIISFILQRDAEQRASQQIETIYIGTRKEGVTPVAKYFAVFQTPTGPIEYHHQTGWCKCNLL